MDFNLACQLLYGFGPQPRRRFVWNFTHHEHIPDEWKGEFVEQEHILEYYRDMRSRKVKNRVWFEDWFEDEVINPGKAIAATDHYLKLNHR